MRELAQQYINSVDGDAHQTAVEIISQLEKAFQLARSSAAGLTNHCEETASTRRCERELEKADALYRAI